MMQNRVFAVYFSIMRRSAIWAVEVMASASSRIISLKFAIGFVAFGWGIVLKICFVLLNVLICSLDIGEHVSSGIGEVGMGVIIPDYFDTSVV